MALDKSLLWARVNTLGRCSWDTYLLLETVEGLLLSCISFLNSFQILLFLKFKNKSHFYFVILEISFMVFYYFVCVWCDEDGYCWICAWLCMHMYRLKPEANVVCLLLQLVLHVNFWVGGSLTKFRVFQFGNTGGPVMSKDPPVSFLRYNYKSSTVFYVSAGEARSSPDAFVENFCPLSHNKETVPNVIN